MNSGPRIKKLSGYIEGQSVTNKDGGDFLPHDKLNEIVSREEVMSNLKDAKVSNPEDLVEFVLKDAKQLFLILVMMEDLSLLRGLQQDEIKDASLPIGFDKEYYGYSLEEREPLGKPRFSIFKDWTRNERRLFDTYQWNFAVPMFNGSQFRFHFHKNRILPFLNSEAEKSVSSGFFGEVSRTEIHPAHIAVSEAVSNSPRCRLSR
jgi:hypothetical protein